MNSLGDAGATLLGGALKTARTLQGGDLSEAVHFTLEDGRQAVVKTGPAPKVEAGMLQKLRAAHVPVPKVLAADAGSLVLEFVPSDGSVVQAWASLGTLLQTLHATIGPHYGWPDDYAFANVTIENSCSDDWPEFFATRRLLTHARHIPNDLARRVERLALDMGNRLPAQPRACLLHGDLWSGNILVAGHRVAALIDPACIFGHAEMDIAMLSLFDCPSPAFYAAYGPLEPGADARLPIYTLWPALVHLRLFGNAYRGMVERCLSTCGA